jgi:predicted nucleotidyltransferase
MLRSEADPTVAIDPAEVARAVEEVFPEALGVWIYGSFADGSARKDSDLDIAILPDRPLDGWDILERAVDVRVGRDIDLVDLSVVSDLLQYEATARGVRVAARDPVRCDLFETAALSKWLDQRRMLRDWMSDIRERGTVY